ncbi:5'/3'-nucleotidase SurE [Chelativorans sp. ZYF759]|uniref:5'/3'-nucleotidase SurE n=1 Tax=Chelativorans sp. ZYF759 TaxID=2692213 RepID=UPI00145F35BD|nr:5'/3'-nucleotidase SurE [Chelativorans sp. ZYF759]NMG38568.1 5'/3'-nucleotidase SurE [Chelativorans sp. ZYF759]
MRILLTNDDGIHAEGLEVLERIARTISDDVWVVAPETDQSGFAHSLSLSEPLRMRKLDDRHYALRGTPTDCVIMGVRRLLPEPPDLILSGVNSGSNIADDVTYSGTIAGAMEGTLLGVRSIALSQAYTVTEEGRQLRWDTAETVGKELIAKLVGLDLPKGVFLNVNFPAIAPGEVKGARVATQGKRLHGFWIDERKDGRGFPYYWLRFGREAQEVLDGTDMAALRDGFVAVTPLHLDLTANEMLDPLAKALS